MTEPRNLLDLPADLPVPIDDGACDHLPACGCLRSRCRPPMARMVDLSSFLDGALSTSIPARAARPAVADRLGRDPRRPRLHAGRVPIATSPPSWALGGDLRVEQSGHRLSAGSRGPPPCPSRSSATSG